MVSVLMMNNWCVKQTYKPPLFLSPSITTQGNEGGNTSKVPFLRFNKPNYYFLFPSYKESKKNLLSFDFYLHIQGEYVVDAE